MPVGPPDALLKKNSPNFFYRMSNDIVCDFVESIDDKRVRLQSLRRAMRLPSNYHPKMVWRRAEDGLFYRGFTLGGDPVAQPPRDISYLKAELRGEHETTRRELNELVERERQWFLDMPPLELPAPVIASKQTKRTLSDYTSNGVTSLQPPPKRIKDTGTDGHEKAA